MLDRVYNGKASTANLSFLIGAETGRPLSPRPLSRYGLVVVSVSTALLLSLIFRSALGGVPFMLFWVAVILSTLFGGLAPGLAASMSAALLVNYFLLDPHYEITLNAEYLLQISLFVFANASISYVYERRRRAEALIVEQGKWYQTALASIGDAVIATDLEGRIVFMNSVAAELTGWPSQDALGQDIQAVFRIVNEDTRLTVENPALRAMREGRIVGLANHTILMCRDGTERLIDDSGSPIYTSGGASLGAVLVFRDVTSSRQTDKALLASENRFRAAQEISLDAFTVLEAVRDETGTIIDFRWIYMNPEAGRILGHEPDTLIGRRLLETMPGNKDNSELFDRYVRAVETGEPHDIEVYYQSDGIDGWFRNMAVRLDDGVAISFSDITERKRVELAEREQRQLTEALHEIAVAMSGALSLSEVLDIILTSLSRVVPYATADLLLCDSQGLAMVAGNHGYAERGPGELLKAAPVAYQDFPLMRRAIDTGQPVVVPDIAACEDWVRLEAEEWRRSYVCVPIRLKNENIGFLNVSSLELDFFTPLLVERLLAFANQAALAVQSARLHEQALVAAATRERERLARDLHDAVSQTLFAASIIAESLPRQWHHNPEKVLPLLEQLHLLTHGAQAEMRTLLLELRPSALLEANLNTLLPQLADAIQSRKRIAIALDVNEPEALPPDVKLSLYRIAQEALNNIAKHSDATQAAVMLKHENGQVELTVSDNGRGFDPASVSPMSLGLGIMRERAAAINASLNITAQPGAGTLVHTQWIG